MIPSSRTPEGDHLRCYLCNAIAWIEASRPTGDVTCPSCGTLNWVGSPGEFAIERVKAVIRSLVAEIATLVAENAPREKLAKRLVEVLPPCLAAHGAMLWRCSRRHWWSPNRDYTIHSPVSATFRASAPRHRDASAAVRHCLSGPARPPARSYSRKTATT